MTFISDIFNNHAISFNEAISTVLTPLQKKIVGLVLLVFAALATCYLVFRSRHQKADTLKLDVSKKEPIIFSSEPPALSARSKVNEGKKYRLNPEYLHKPFVTRGEALRKTADFDAMDLQELHLQCKQSPNYLKLPLQEQVKFSRFIDNIVHKTIPRDKEVFATSNESENSYQTLGNTVKATLLLLKTQDLEVWERVANLYAIAVDICPISYADSSFQAYLLVSDQMDLEETTNSIENKVLILLNQLRVNIVRHISLKWGRGESHTAISIMKLIGKTRNIVGQDLIQISDKQDDIQDVSAKKLEKHFDKEHTMEAVVDWIYTAINGLPPFSSSAKMIPPGEVIDHLFPNAGNTDERMEQLARAYDAPSYSELLDNPDHYQHLSKETVAQLLEKINILSICD